MSKIHVKVKLTHQGDDRILKFYVEAEQGENPMSKIRQTIRENKRPHEVIVSMQYSEELTSC